MKTTLRRILILGTIVLILGAIAWADNMPVGFNHWLKDNGDAIKTFGDSYPFTYQREDDDWDNIVPDWLVVNDTTAKVVRGIHRLFAFKNGNVYYVRPRQGIRHAIGLRAMKLIKFDKTDSSYMTIANVDYDSVSINGPRLTYHNIFPGVDRVCIYDNILYTDRFVFNQSARDTLSEYGPWVNHLLGVVSKIDIDSLNLTLKDRNGVFSPTVGGRITDGWIMMAKSDTLVLVLQESYLQTVDSLTSVVVHKRVVIQSGQPYLVELFNPIPTVQWPDGPIWHNAEFGYDSTLTLDLEIEEDIIGMSFVALSSSGTLDSMRAHLTADVANIDFRMAVYDDPGDRDYDLIDSTAMIAVPKTSPGSDWVGAPLEENVQVSSGTRYALVGWGEDQALSNIYIRYRPANTAQASDTIIYDVGAGWGAWPDPVQQDLGEDYQRPVAIIAFYTEPVAGRTIIYGRTDVEDAGIQEGFNAENNYGGASSFIAEDAVNEKSALIRVKNVAARLEAGATITACTLAVRVQYNNDDGDVGAFRVFKPWVEGDEDGTDDDDGDVTYPDWASDASEWGTAGCNSTNDAGVDNSTDGGGDDRKATAEDEVDVTTAETRYYWDISTDLAQGWYDGTIEEEGVILWHGTSGTENVFYSTEASNESYRPYWIFHYSTGAPAAGRRARVEKLLGRKR